MLLRFAVRRLRTVVVRGVAAACVVTALVLVWTWNDRAAFARESVWGQVRRMVQARLYEGVDANAWLDAADAVAAASGPRTSAVHRLCVVVPFRDREQELAELLPALARRLAADGLANSEWDVVVVNQVDTWRFNRGALLNAGVAWAKAHGADWVALNDVDRLPVDPNLRYRFPHGAFVHLSPWIMDDGYLPEFVGGSGLMTVATYEAVDGHTNIFWGWGAEDAEFYNRLLFHGVPVIRPAVPRARWRGALAHFHNESVHARDYLEGGVPDPHRIHPTGLRTLRARTVAETAMTIGAVRFTRLDVALECDLAISPWCARQNGTTLLSPIKYTAT